MHDLRFLSAFLFLLEIAGCIHNLHQPPSVSLFSTLLPPSFFLPPSPLLSPGNLAFAALLISILQNVQMPPKIIHLPALWCRFTCIQTMLSTFCTASQTKAEGQGLLLFRCVGPIMRHPLVWCFLTSLFTPITSSISSTKGFWHCDDDWWFLLRHGLNERLIFMQGKLNT